MSSAPSSSRSGQGLAHPEEEQRSDVPYRWPRGPRPRLTARERRVRSFWLALTAAMVVLTVIALWMMLETRW